MGETVEFPSNGHTLLGVPRHPGERPWAGRGGDPGVLGTCPAHPRSLRSIRRRGLRGARSRPLPRQGDQGARRGRQAADGARPPRGRPRHARCGHVAGSERPHRGGSGRHRRFLHGGRPGPLRGHAERRLRRGGALLPVPGRDRGGQARGAARSRAPCSATSPTKDHAYTREQVDALEAELHAAGVDVEFFWYAGADHAFFNDTRPEVYDPDASRLAWDRTRAFFRTHLATTVAPV